MAETHAENNTPSLVDCFPPEIILQIAQLLPRFKNSHSNSLVNLALTSKALYEILRPLLFDALYVDKNAEYPDFERAMKSRQAFVNCLQTNTRVFAGKLQYYKDKEDMIQLPTLSKLTDVRLTFQRSNAEGNGCALRHPYPKNINLPVSAINKLVCCFEKLISVRLDGLLHSIVVYEGLAKLFETAKNLRRIDIKFDDLSRDEDDMNLESSYKSISEPLASLQQLQKFAISDSSLSYMLTDDQRQLISDIILGLKSVPTLTDFSLRTRNTDLNAELIPFLSHSNISRLLLDYIEIRPELADAIRRMRLLTHLSLSWLRCPKLLFNRPQDFKPAIKKYLLKYVCFNDYEPSTEILDLSNAESFEELHVNIAKDIYRSLSTSFKLRDLRCCVRDEENFGLLVDLIQNVDSLRRLAVNYFPREEQPEHYDAYYDLLYDAIRISSIRVLELNPRMIWNDKFESLLRSETSLEEFLIFDSFAIRNGIDFPKMCALIASNSKSRFKSLTVTLELQIVSELFKVLEVYRNHGKFRIKFISHARDSFSKLLKHWFLRVMLSVIESWEKFSSSLIDRVVLDELSDDYYEFIVKYVKRRRSVKFGCVDGEFCMYKK
ncbi:hypothetical protein HK098_004138 [Nowakowskiella sp. JEL0407]|nr:hypothetical protein HK098_004138 [Nowakowskiella sp. JEL0407]